MAELAHAQTEAGPRYFLVYLLRLPSVFEARTWRKPCHGIFRDLLASSLVNAMRQLLIGNLS
jgi:hypothetical protein